MIDAFIEYLYSLPYAPIWIMDRYTSIGWGVGITLTCMYVWFFLVDTWNYCMEYAMEERDPLPTTMYLLLGMSILWPLLVLRVMAILVSDFAPVFDYLRFKRDVKNMFKP